MDELVSPRFGCFYERTEGFRSRWFIMESLKNFLARGSVVIWCCVFGLRVVMAAETAPAPAPVALALVPAGGVFVSNVAVTITGSTGEVRFTLDGSLPGTNSSLYAPPLLVSNSCLLQARAFAAGQPTGALAGATFTLLETNLADFHSSLPLRSRCPEAPVHDGLPHLVWKRL